MLIWPLLISLSAAAASSSNSLLLEGAAVYVSPDAAPRERTSVLVREGKIAFVGDAARARELAGATPVIDVTGRYVFAGWADAHGHLAGLGLAREIADLRGASDAGEAARRIEAKARSLPPKAWAQGRGWDQNLWPGAKFPDARDLDAAVLNRPALARRVDGHALWVNSEALRLARIEASTQDPPGGRILRRAGGSPSGVLVDNAMQLVERVAEKSGDPSGDFERRMLAATRACAAVGLTEVQDASGYGPQEIAELERLAGRGLLPIRVYATVSAAPENLERALAKPPRIGEGADFLTVRAVKAYADGALGSRGAALFEDYSDEPGQRGLLVTAPERLDAIARETREKGWQLWIHAIGDRGNRVALDALAKARAAVRDAAPGATRPRIEHAQVVALEDIPRFAKEGVIASVQPTHATSDMPWAEKRVGALRIRGAYAWRKLASSGARLAGGSDFPVESENPMLGFYAAITRQDLSGNPPGGWRPEEKLTRREALALFTTDAAWAAFEEKRRGKIEPGFDGDLTVLASDPMTAPERDIPGIATVLTIVGGRIAYGTGLAAGAGR